MHTFICTYKRNVQLVEIPNGHGTQHTPPCADRYLVTVNGMVEWYGEGTAQVHDKESQDRRNRYLLLYPYGSL